MKNPWLSHNPFLSLWLQAANTAFGVARGHALSAARRQQRAMINESARTMMAFWSGWTTLPPPKPKRKR